MQKNNIPPFNQHDTPKGVCVVDGHGIKIRVDKRHLVVEDGIGRSRRERRFHKATTNLKRLVILGTTGYMSLEAVRWLADASIPMVHVDPEGRLLTASQPMGSDRAALRRAQAWALTNEVGLDVVRYLLDRKLEGQAHITSQLGGSRTEIDEANRQLEETDSLDGLMWLEAQAANHYWHAWADVECQFIKKDESTVPDHWRRFGTRGSKFNANGPRGAANPPNAILNYLYALLEAEAVFACQTVGLDPGVGILHADQRARDSFALDLMEPVRPLVDQWVMRLLSDHRFKASDFADTRRGICRLSPMITHWLAETTAMWATAIAPHAEEVAKMLAKTPDIRIDRIPTPLTGANRSISRPARPKKQGSSSATPKHCHTCGTATEAGRTQCDTCLPLVQSEHLEEMVNGAHERLRELRDEGRDPAHGNEAATRRGESVSANNRASTEWNRNNKRLDSQVFTTEILPFIQEVPLSAIVQATGLSKGYCSFIKRGIKVPHERHWRALSQLGRKRSRGG